MRIEHIQAKNVLGVRNVDVELDTPVTIFSGENWAGKSSLQEAIRMALGSDPIRVALKRDYTALVTDGARTGAAAVILDGLQYAIKFPDGERVGNLETIPDIVQYVLDAPRLALMSADDRRTFLFRLSGKKPTAAVVKEMLLVRECNEKKIDKVLPLMRDGFPAAAAFAAEEARNAKSDWKAVTNEAWGSKKSGGWKAPVPDSFDAARLEAITPEIAAIEERIDTHAKSVGVLQEKRRTYLVDRGARDARATLAAKLPALEKKLAVDLADLVNWESKVAILTASAGNGPRVGLVHDLAAAVHYFVTQWESSGAQEELNAQSALTAYEEQHGAIGKTAEPAAAEDLAKAIAARDLMARSVENDRRDIAAAHAASQAQAEIAPEAVLDADIEAAQTKLAELRAGRQALDLERQKLQVAERAASQATEKTRNATLHHGNVVGWLAISDALSPDGIPSELLASALKPVNDRLRRASISTDWAQVSIAADISISAGGRPYALLSESERWIVDTTLTEMVSYLSGIKLFSLDRFDVLSVPNRGILLGWLDELAANGELDTALVFGTLKAVPTGLPDTMRAHWIAGGTIAQSTELAEAA